MSALLRVTGEFSQNKRLKCGACLSSPTVLLLHSFIAIQEPPLPLGVIQVGSWNHCHLREDHFRHASDCKEGQAVAVCRERSQGRGRSDHGPYPGYLRAGTVQRDRREWLIHDYKTYWQEGRELIFLLRQPIQGQPFRISFAGQRDDQVQLHSCPMQRWEPSLLELHGAGTMGERR